jgi:hypothetical protein
LETPRLPPCTDDLHVRLKDLVTRLPGCSSRIASRPIRRPLGSAWGTQNMCSEAGTAPLPLALDRC